MDPILIQQANSETVGRANIAARQLADVRVLRVKRLPIKLEAYRLRTALDTDYSIFVDEPTMVIDDDTNEVVIIYLELDLDPAPIIAALQRIQFNEDFRTDGLPNRTATVGFLPRNTIRRDFCTATRLAYDQPEEHGVVCDYAGAVNAYYQSLNPTLHQMHDAITDAHVQADYRIKGSPFTSGIINKNNPLKYHFDAGNFKKVWSCMLVFKHAIRGGHLACPEYGLGFRLRHNSLFMFDGQRILHGVTPIIKLTEESWRYSIVYYSMQQMWHCEPLGSEVQRIRSLKTGREQRRAALMESLRVDMRAPVEYPIFVLSKDRPHRASVLNILRGAKLPYTVLVEPRDYPAYRQDYPHASFLILPESDMGLARARQWLLDYCASVGYPYYWQIDDSCEFRYLADGIEHEVTPNVTLEGIERLARTRPDLLMIGADRGKLPGTVPPTGVYADALPRVCVLMNVDGLKALPQRVAYRPEFVLHEDLDFGLQVQAQGGATAVSAVYRVYKPLLGKTSTGGQVEWYRQGLDRPMKERLAATWPDRVSLVPTPRTTGIDVKIAPPAVASPTVGEAANLAAQAAVAAIVDLGMAAYEQAEDDEIRRLESAIAEQDAAARLVPAGEGRP